MTSTKCKCIDDVTFTVGMYAHTHYRKEWLSTVGSPKSRIDRCDFSQEKSIPKLEYPSFTIRR